MKFELFNRIIDFLGTVKVIGGLDASKHSKRQAIELLEHCKKLIDKLIEEYRRELNE